MPPLESSFLRPHDCGHEVPGAIPNKASSRLNTFGDNALWSCTGRTRDYLNNRRRYSSNGPPALSGGTPLHFRHPAENEGGWRRGSSVELYLDFRGVEGGVPFSSL